MGLRRYFIKYHTKAQKNELLTGYQQYVSLLHAG